MEHTAEGKIIDCLRKEDLCNDRYTTTFKCHQCSNTFNTRCMIGVIGNVRNNIESAVNRKLVPAKCKVCESTSAIFERQSGNFTSIPILLTFEIGHLHTLKQLAIPDIDRQFTISHNH